jgi:hypothetical protein
MKSNEGKGFHSNGRVHEPYDKWFENNMFPSENGITSFFVLLIVKNGI